MGYVFLIIALIGGVLKGFCGKKISAEMTDMSDALTINLVRMCLCVLISFIIASFQSSGMNVFKVDITTITFAFISGVFSAASVILWLLCVNKGAYTMVDAFIMTGAAIPMIGSLIVLDESVRYAQWIGFAILVAGVIILCMYNNSIKPTLTLKSLMLLIFVGVSNGVVDFIQKLFAITCTGQDNAVFNFYTYLFATLVILTVMKFKGINISGKKDIVKADGVYICVMSICLFVNSYFKVEAARYIDAVKLYPLNQGAALVLGMIMANIFFGEKINSKCIIGIIFGFMGICIVNMS